MGVGGQRHAAAALPPRRSEYREEKISCPVASRYPELCTQFTVDIIRVSIFFLVIPVKEFKTRYEKFFTSLLYTYL
jgi:hypothetical protein